MQDVLSKYDVIINEEVFNDVQKLYRPALLLPSIPKYEYSKHEDCDEYLYWEREKERFNKGWVAPDGHYINGMYYLYLNYVKININSEEDGAIKLSNPLYFVEDEELFDMVWFGRGRGLGKPSDRIIGTKGRRQHFSENTHSGMLIWFLLVNMGRDCFILYPDDDYRKKTKPKFDIALSNMPEELFYDLYKGMSPVKGKKQIDRRQVLKPFSIEQVGLIKLVNNIETQICKIHFVIDGKDKKSPISGGNYDFGVIDESGKFVSLQSAVGFADEALSDGDNRYGVLIVGGTTDNITVKSKDFVNYLVNPSKHGFKFFFLPAYVMKTGMYDPKTGVSDKIKGEAFIKDKWAKASEISEFALKLAKQENPLTLNDAIGFRNESNLPVERIEEMLLHISINELDKAPFIKRGSFDCGLDLNGNKDYSNISFIESNNGNWTLLNIDADPDYNNLHTFFIDDVSVEKPSRIDRNTSRQCCIVWRNESMYHSESNYPIAIFHGRDERSMFHEQVLMASVYFGVSDRMVVTEYNDSALRYFFDLNGHGDKIFYHGGVPGITMKADRVSRAGVLAIKFFATNVYKRIYFHNFWEQLLYSNNRNSDIRSAFFVYLIYKELIAGTIVSKKIKREESKLIRNVGTSNWNQIDYNRKIIRR